MYLIKKQKHCLSSAKVPGIFDEERLPRFQLLAKVGQFLRINLSIKDEEAEIKLPKFLDFFQDNLLLELIRLNFTKLFK